MPVYTLHLIAITHNRLISGNFLSNGERLPSSVTSCALGRPVREGGRVLVRIERGISGGSERAGLRMECGGVCRSGGGGGFKCRGVESKFNWYGQTQILELCVLNSCGEPHTIRRKVGSKKNGIKKTSTTYIIAANLV